DGTRRERAPLPDLPAGAVGLEEALKSWRRERAKADKVSAFIVCSDRTLRAIAAVRPTSLAGLRRIDGIGPTKLEAYGEEMLALIAAGADGGELR
nr:HRDC domain-containing protein [Actinomycetota bacterium]